MLHCFRLYVAESSAPSLLEMSNTHTCVFSLVVLCLGSVTCKEFYFEKGKTDIISCGTAPGRTIEWMYGSQLIVKQIKNGPQAKGPAPMAPRARMSQGTLRLSSPENADGGSYSCVDGQTGGTIQLHQVYIVSALASPSSLVLQGTRVELRCQVSAGSSATPGPSATPVWLQPNGTAVETPKDGSIILQPVELHHAGVWACQVSPERKLSLTITVIGLSSTPKLSVSQGESVLLPCWSPSSIPKDWNLQEAEWKKLSPVPATLLSLGGEKGNLLWKSMGVKGYSLQFEDKKLPGNLSVTLKKVTVQQSGQYQCLLKFQDKGTVKALVTLEVKGQPGNVNVNVNDNDNGPGTNGLNGKDGLLGLSLWVWLAIGVGCLVLTVLICITVYLTKRNKRMKRRARKLRSLTARDYCKCNRGSVGRPNGRRRDAPSGKEGQR
ncbi:hypothetical protein COCON_G00004340 [Conger conger]|uniref:Ig-like domain-containing protein n=1 Tax=Conger conger TaxID=82655 RepID=A0A9Q1I8E1_CONCO|nr:hypothetical protein COCON_G00004340 [Conger conger]